jgi:hypothetical protein
LAISLVDTDNPPFRERSARGTDSLAGKTQSTEPPHRARWVAAGVALPWVPAWPGAPPRAPPCFPSGPRLASPPGASCERGGTLSPSASAPCSPPAAPLHAAPTHPLAGLWVGDALLLSGNRAGNRNPMGARWRSRRRTSLVDELAEGAALATALRHGQRVELEPRQLGQLEAPAPRALHARAPHPRPRAPGRTHHQPLAASPAPTVRSLASLPARVLAPRTRQRHARRPPPGGESPGGANERRSTPEREPCTALQLHPLSMCSRVGCVPRGSSLVVGASARRRRTPQCDRPRRHAGAIRCSRSADVGEAYEHCRKQTAFYAQTFYFASLFQPEVRSSSSSSASQTLTNPNPGMRL